MRRTFVRFSLSTVLFIISFLLSFAMVNVAYADELGTQEGIATATIENIVEDKEFTIEQSASGYNVQYTPFAYETLSIDKDFFSNLLKLNADESKTTTLTINNSSDDTMQYAIAIIPTVDIDNQDIDVLDAIEMSASSNETIIMRASLNKIISAGDKGIVLATVEPNQTCNIELTLRKAYDTSDSLAGNALSFFFLTNETDAVNNQDIGSLIEDPIQKENSSSIISTNTEQTTQDNNANDGVLAFDVLPIVLVVIVIVLISIIIIIIIQKKSRKKMESKHEEK